MRSSKMRWIGIISIGLLLIILIAIISTKDQRPVDEIVDAINSEATFLVGFGVIDITPPIGSPFDNGLLKAEGVLDTLYAKAVVIDDGQRRIALVALDLIGAQRNILDPATERAMKLTGIPEDLIMIHSTQTYTGQSGGEGVLNSTGDISVSPYADKSYLRVLSRKIGDSIAVAADSMFLASISFGSAELHGISFTKEDLVLDDRDETIRVVVFKDQKNQPVGVVVNFPLPPKIVKGTKFSADFPYFITKKIQSQYPDCNVLFLNGLNGDVSHIDHSNLDITYEGYEYACEVGTRIGAEVLKILEDAAPIKRSLLAGELLKINVAKDAGTSIESYLHVLTIGDIALLGLPGELLSETGLRIRENSPFQNLIIAGTTGDDIGYIPMLQIFDVEKDKYIELPGAVKEIQDSSISLLSKLYLQVSEE